ncbi:peptidoglycan DD-metalloendopeptidase family protein [Bacillus infantis]|uniref:Peptidoglycan DD-metalloendopeptidase family protein n=1 Tax=Bacillus infantis TaxID=324767 RepID=A0A5D4RD80_9BACI|nr:peptidoglycan DD-metalloendopeptidase family protein [Bacillus infantis]TYS49345.1 peptidoglycan DD-metalloendopeptidase family protein [Bacillus infantis]
MRDYIRRFLIAWLVLIFISLLIIGGKQPQASELHDEVFASDWQWPADGVLSDCFGTRNGTHKGIDIASDSGTPVYAVDEGSVTRSYYSGSYGNVIFIKHQNGTETVYAHLQERKAAEGEKVLKGQTIGTMGSTGDSSGVHLHFEVHISEWTYDKQNAVDPFLALGETEIGSAVSSVQPAEGSKTIETASLLLADDNGQHFPAAGRKAESAGRKIQSGIAASETMETFDYKPPAVPAAEAHEHRLRLRQLMIASRSQEKGKEAAAPVYEVRAGDTLYSISAKLGTTVSQLKKANSLTDDIIHPGEILSAR